ncbi:hypothetical protein [Burkholderia sp. Tr-20390]|uniref:hypothetical protein n=1 Tax=Burkholderia sp. Tr-20390 TaxID=2703904 RepID=UPI0019803EF0|nr:hypothetical protein [Burkholderia sp. Tr-20390]MBN3729400.1 hypothetical protein [Burkholderia sp. Tr-20390]
MKWRLGVALLVVPLAAHAQLVQWLYELQRSTSALGVLTAQISLSGAQANNQALQAQQALSSSAIDLYIRDQVRQTIDKYGEKGQLVDGCYQVSMATQMGATSEATSTGAAAALARIYTLSDSGLGSAGGIAGALGATKQVTQFPFAASVGARSARHATNYCTVSEAQLGYCTLNANGMQGGDQDFSLHLQPGKTYGWDQTEAMTDFTKRIAPVRPVPQSGKCSTPACVAALAARRDQEALMSMARFSFMRFSAAHETQKSATAGE